MRYSRKATAGSSRLAYPMRAWRSSIGWVTCSSWRRRSARPSSCASTQPCMPEQPVELRVVTDDGVELAGEQAGEGPPIVLLHGLTATHRYVVMGSRTLEREGYKAILYDARGHGRSTAGPVPGDYGYECLARDLEAVLDALRLARAALAGASMGAHTAVRFALLHPERVAGLGLITPSFDPDLPLSEPVIAERQIGIK